MEIIKITSLNAKQTIFTFITNLFAYSNKTKSFIKRLIRKGDVKVNNNKVYDNYILKENDEVKLFYNIKINSQKMDFLDCKLTSKIFYEDENIVIFDKNKNILCQASKNEKINTLNNYLKKRQYLKKAWDGIDLETRPNLIHRLDQNTTGLILAGKNKKITVFLNEAMIKKQIIKKYLAVVHGDFSNYSATYHHYIQRSDSKNNLMLVSSQKNNINKEIITKYQFLKKWNNFSLVEAELITGRKNQIRAQLAYLGFLIVGDYKYANKKYFSKNKSQILISNELKFAFDNKHQLAYLNEKKFQKLDYKNFKFEQFIKI